MEEIGSRGEKRIEQRRTLLKEGRLSRKPTQNIAREGGYHPHPKSKSWRGLEETRGGIGSQSLSLPHSKHGERKFEGDSSHPSTKQP